MPTIEVSHKDLCSLIGRKFTAEELRDTVLFAKCELDSYAGDTIKLDIKDTNRPDLWSAEGVAREIKLRIKQKFPEYKVGKSKVVVNVDKDMKDVRPLTVCAVVRGLKITENVLSQLIQLQEKVSGTYGRNRKEVAIGVYDLQKIKSPIRFMPIRPDGIKFVPLDFEKEITPREILEKHPKGKEYAHLLKGMSRFPIFIDADNKVLSVPPIINSNHTGKVTTRTRDLFIECSGFDFRFLMPALNVLVAALHERGGKIEAVTVNYGSKKIVTPSLSPKKFSVNADYVNKVSGLSLSKGDITKLLSMSGYKAEVAGKSISLLYPAYRQDIMHPRDVVEDIIISYGMNNIQSQIAKLSTKGVAGKAEGKIQRAADIMVGCGLQEILSYTLTNRSDLFDKMNVTGHASVEIENPQSANWSVFRNWLLPSLMDFLSKNRHIEYPQKIFEIGACTLADEKAETRSKDVTKLACAITNSNVSYEEISSLLDAFMRNIGVKYSLKIESHRSFLEGRCAAVMIEGRHVGWIGEIHPQVLNNWKIEKPVVALEIDLDVI